MVEELAVDEEIETLDLEEKKPNESSNNDSFSDSIKTISIVANGDIQNIVLSDFNKDKITFGRDHSNDIIIPSLFVSKFHGYFEIKNNILRVVDNESKNGISVNGTMVKQKELVDNDFIRIDNEESRLKNGILILVNINDNVNRWNYYKLSILRANTIGNKGNCNIHLRYESEQPDYVEVRKKGDQFVLDPINKMVLLNNNIIEGPTVLQDNDLIDIEGQQLIFYKNVIFYQFDERGVSVDVQHIYKTVKVKGKKKNISQDINMHIAPGEFVAFIGASGVGKSTLMHMMCGINKPTKGKVFINGTDLFKNYEAIKNVIGYVPQDDIVHTNLTLQDMLSYSAELRMPDNATSIEKDRRIKEVLDIVDLTGYEHVMIKNLSGGQRKRAGIAVELLADPKLFFLDEPTSGLDPKNEREMMKTLRKMADSGRTVVLVTHNTVNVHMCDKLVFFGEGGKICFDGKHSEIKEFFGTDDFVEIYSSIDTDPNRWHQKYLKTRDENRKLDEDEDSETKLKKKRKSVFRQYNTLTRRYIKTILNNKFQLFLLTIQTPLIVIGLSAIMSAKVFEYYEKTKAIVFSVSLAALYIGLGDSIQEICKERVILKKEFMANLRLSAYVASKITVMLILSFLQSLLFVYTFKLLNKTPVDGVMYSWTIEMIITMTITVFSSATIGLLVSSISRDESAAMTYLPLLLVPQSLFCGMLFELEGITIKISNFILCRWSLEMLGTTNNLNNMINSVQEVVPGFIREAEPFFEFTASHFQKDFIIIILMTLIFIILCYHVLRHQLEVKK